MLLLVLLTREHLDQLRTGVDQCLDLTRAVDLARHA
jgi:hypothetical protein